MDVILMIVFFALFSVVTDQLDKKKRRQRPTQKPEKQLPHQMPAPEPQRSVPVNREEPIPFKIPELRNAPLPADDVYRESMEKRQQEEKDRELLEEQRRRQVYVCQHREPEWSADSAGQTMHPGKRLFPAFTPDTAQQAVIMAEIHGRPKAYRR